VISLTLDGRVDFQTTGIEAIHNKTFWQTRQYSDLQIPNDNNTPNDHPSMIASNSDSINDIENMDRTRQIGDLSVYYYYARTVGPVLCAVFPVGHALLAFAENFPQVWLSKWTTAGGGQLPLYIRLCGVGTGSFTSYHLVHMDRLP